MRSQIGEVEKKQKFLVMYLTVYDDSWWYLSPLIVAAELTKSKVLFFYFVFYDNKPNKCYTIFKYTVYEMSVRQLEDQVL